MAPDDPDLALPTTASPSKLAALAWCAVGLGLAALGVLYGADHALTSGAARKAAPHFVATETSFN